MNIAKKRLPDVLHFEIRESSLGLVLVAASQTGVCAVLLGDDGDMLRREFAARFPRASTVEGGSGRLSVLAAAVLTLIESPPSARVPAGALPLDPRGTPFQRSVWEVLRTIPAGCTASYAEVAARTGRPRSARAVAGACAANPLAVVVPCHRVVRRDGSLSGYRWGIARKQFLLEREAATPQPADQLATGA